MKKAVLLGMIGLLALGWAVTAQGLMEGPARYRSLMEEAGRYESQKIYVSAIDCYKQALELKPGSIELNTKIAADYLNLGDEVSFINYCNAVNEEHGYPVGTALMETDYYMERQQEKKAISVLQKALKHHKDSQELLGRYDKLKYTYTDAYLRFDGMYPFRNDSAVVMNGDRYGLIKPNGNTLMKCGHDWLGPMSDDGEYIPVADDGEFYYANSSGYRIEVPRQGQKVEWLGTISGGIAPAKINGKYGYINAKFEEQSPFQWDGASVMKNGIGAVMQGGKWALINDSYELVTDYIYDDVKMDEYGFCSISGRIFAKGQQGYIMLDEKGQQVGEQAFEDVRPFLTKEPAAVQISGKWGFAGMDGKLVIEPKYEAAGAFSSGLAPVRQGEDWGYVTVKDEMAIKPQYTEAGSFYKGIAPVKDGNMWTAIVLNIK